MIIPDGFINKAGEKLFIIRYLKLDDLKKIL